MVIGKELYEELRFRIKEINKFNNLDHRLDGLISLKQSTHNKINDELDEIFSGINLKEKKNDICNL